ncbi:hypothetical protein PL373_01610 [Tenacibaculum maritimum]|nr:hypothetical protein [Tenacibaculum maritimum]MDB0599868.1 hypothetical protein [Tenacibaculum maritimum]MDB0610979.1 hypothetical protein [Tenacibaculum maritimum]
MEVINFLSLHRLMEKDVLVKKAVNSGSDSYGFKDGNRSLSFIDSDYFYDALGDMASIPYAKKHCVAAARRILKQD